MRHQALFTLLSMINAVNEEPVPVVRRKITALDAGNFRCVAFDCRQSPPLTINHNTTQPQSFYNVSKPMTSHRVLEHCCRVGKT
ncbi:hypothetical protein F4818DRAFT_211087 [Hypoxylon cercidicola]|nr:hypothetical protein F4818DRAFT_211087 [Hypoxylon cercidicola]